MNNFLKIATILDFLRSYKADDPVSGHQLNREYFQIRRHSFQRKRTSLEAQKHNQRDVKKQFDDECSDVDL